MNKYLHTVASVGFLFTLNYDARNHKLKIYSIYIALLKNPNNEGRLPAEASSVCGKLHVALFHATSIGFFFKMQQFLHILIYNALDMDSNTKDQ